MWTLKRLFFRMEGSGRGEGEGLGSEGQTAGVGDVLKRGRTQGLGLLRGTVGNIEG